MIVCRIRGKIARTAACHIVNHSYPLPADIRACTFYGSFIRQLKPILKISPVGDWWSTSLEWRFSILDP